MKREKKIKIFIYSLLAWFVGMAVLAAEVGEAYAKSFDEDVLDASWHYFDKDGETSINTFDIYDYEKCIVPDDALNNNEFVEHFTFALNDSGSAVGVYDYYFSSNSEMVVAFCNQISVDDLSSMGMSSGNENGTFIFILCKTSFRYYGGYAKEPDEESSKFTSGSSAYMNGFEWKRFDFNFYRYVTGARRAINSGKMKVFTSVADAKNYLNTGDLSGLAWQGGGPEYDGEHIYLDNFQMIVHDSNAYSAYYIEFKYAIPDALKDADSLVLDIAEQYSYCVTAVASLARLPSEYSGTDKIDLLQYPSGFKLYLKDIDAIESFVNKAVLSTDGMAMRRVLGSEGYLDSDSLSLDGLGLNTVCQITNSKLYLTCYVVANGKYGQSVNGDVDFLSGSNGMGTYTPDTSGNYSYNGDYKNNGRYYDQVGTDAAGNTSHTYYYYDTDNSKNNITSNDFSNNSYTPGASSSVGSVIQNNNVTLPDHIFVTVSGSSGSGTDVGNVTIEDDDLSFDSLRESIKDGYGLIDDTDTGVKGDGLIAMMSDLFGYLPAKFVGLIMLGTSSVVGIAILRMIFKR